MEYLQSGLQPGLQGMLSDTLQVLRGRHRSPGQAALRTESRWHCTHSAAGFLGHHSARQFARSYRYKEWAA